MTQVKTCIACRGEEVASAEEVYCPTCINIILDAFEEKEVEGMGVTLMRFHEIDRYFKGEHLTRVGRGTKLALQRLVAHRREVAEDDCR